MKKLTCYYKRLNITNIRIAVLAIIVSIFFLPTFVPFEKLGNNMFTVILNRQNVGVVSSPEDAEEYVLEARRRIAAGSEELVLVESDLQIEGREVLWGKVDAPEKIIDGMTQVLAGDVKETLKRSYVVKINEYMINLASQSDVYALLQAALDKYDSADRYQAELSLDHSRELSALTADVRTTEEVVEETREVVNMEAGITAELAAAYEASEPEGEMDFEDYELGLISMEYGDSIEVVEAYLGEEELTGLNEAIREVTQ
ncbi:MAG: peptidase M23, partial [Lachnospiraceae bacterium]|nr:peptidase M23 [Lachnospiraceae bacterium]